MCAVPIWPRRLRNSTSWKLAMQIKKLLRRTVNYPQLCVERIYTFLYKPLFKYAISSEHQSESSSVPVCCVAAENATFIYLSVNALLI